MKRVLFVIMLGVSATLEDPMPGFSRAYLSEDDSPSTAALQEQLKALEQRVQMLEKLLKSQSVSAYGPAAEAGRPSASSPEAARLEEPGKKPATPERRLEPEQKDAETNKKDSPIAGAGANGFSLTSPDGDFNLKVRAHFQADGRFFAGDAADTSASTFATRVARLLFEGTLARYFDFRFMPDFAGGRLVLQDAYMDVRFLPQIRLRAGKFKTPFGLERLKQEVNLSLVERALPYNLFPNRDLVIQVHGDLFGGVLNYMGGVFNGVPDGASADQDNQDSKDYAGRIFAQPFLKTEIH